MSDLFFYKRTNSDCINYKKLASMEWTKRSKSVDNFLQKKNAKYYKDNINLLLNNIKVEKYTKEDIAFIIIFFLFKSNFKKLTQANIIKYFTNPK